MLPRQKAGVIHLTVFLFKKHVIWFQVLASLQKGKYVQDKGTSSPHEHHMGQLAQISHPHAPQNKRFIRVCTKEVAGSFAWHNFIFMRCLASCKQLKAKSLLSCVCLSG